METIANKLNVVVTIPENYVLVEKAEYDRLVDADDIGRYWTMKDVLKRINRKRSWFMNNVINKPKWQNKIDVKKGGFVYYPRGGGDKYLFKPSETKRFLEDNFSEILK